MKQHILSGTIAACMVLQISSCGKQTPAEHTPVVLEHRGPQVILQEEVKETGGQFLAVLSPVNEIVSGRISGGATISIEKDEFVGDVRFAGGPLTAASLHAQSLREGTRCPTSDDDKNQDGLIDAFEGEMVYGKTIMPLDGDLNAQHLELGTWPFADEFGMYIYSETASYEKLLRDLKETDINPDDSLIKLSSEATLVFPGKVVIVEGVSREANLPETVSSNSRLDRHYTFPVACGVLSPVISHPGTIDRDSGRDAFERKPGGTAGEDDGTVLIPPDVNHPEVEGAATNYGDDGA